MNSNKYKITKLDKRYAGHYYYKCFVTPYATSGDAYLKDFIDFRIWCWETWGPSTELDISFRNKFWAWDTKDSHFRIYLNDEAYTFFILKFTA